MASSDPLVQMIKPFDPEEDTSTVAIRWEKWVSRFEVYLVAKAITDGDRKKAQLLLLSGPKVYDIYDTLAEDTDDYGAVKTKLANYFKPFKDEAMAVFMFREQVQKPGESVDQFVTRLRAQAKHCGFTDTSKEIRAQVLQKTINKKLRREVLKHPTWTLNEVLAEARAIENSEARAGDIEGRGEETVNRMRNVPRITMQNRQGQGPGQGRRGRGRGRGGHGGHRGQQKSQNSHQRGAQSQGAPQSDVCGKCGNRPHQGGSKNCPANGRKCNKCHKIGHYGKMCRSKTQQVHNLQAGDRESDGAQGGGEYEYHS